MECKNLQSQGMWSEGLGKPVMSAMEVMAVLRSFGMGKFAGAVMWVIHEVFGGVDEKFPQMNTDGHGCPQADEVGEQQLSAIGQQFKNICLQTVYEERLLILWINMQVFDDLFGGLEINEYLCGGLIIKY